ncbi:MAG: FAD-dependent monooxygenase [Tatlockia sp.]|jgi:2-octaprenylphenol hydroxylase
MKQKCDVVVVGGGVVGLTAALAMHSCGFQVVLLDAAKIQGVSLQNDPRVYAINQASEALWRSLGVWEHIDRTRLSPYQRMYVWDALSQDHIQFDSRTIAASSLGVIMEESVIKEAIYKTIAAQPAGITLLAENAVKAIEQKEDSIEISTASQCFEAKLLMVADGANSPCRQLLNIPIRSWSYHQHAVVAEVSTEKEHQQTAYQVFNADGPLAFLPLANSNRCSIVWSTTPARAKALMELTDPLFNKELTEAFASKLGQVEVQGRRYQFPLTLRHTRQYSGSRWLLLGDAAHTIHPLAGLGLNVGLADVASWMSCLDKRNIASKKALNAYQRERKHAVWQTIAMMDGLKTLFSNPLPPLVALRGLGLSLCNRITPLKRFFIEQAAGKKRHYS